MIAGGWHQKFQRTARGGSVSRTYRVALAAAIYAQGPISEVEGSSELSGGTRDTRDRARDRARGDQSQERLWLGETAQLLESGSICGIPKS